MEHHALESTKGLHYAEMGRFLTPKGEQTSDEALAAKTADGQPVENGLRNLWVTETALTTALNTAFFAERVAVFSIVMGVGSAAHGNRVPRPHAGWRARVGRAAEAGEGKLDTASAAT